MTKFFFTLLFLFFASWAQAAVTFDAVATTDANGTASPSVNVTVGGGCADRAIVAYVAWYSGGAGPGSVSSMTIGGSAATFIAGVSPGSAGINRRIEMWYRAGNSTGSNTVTATMDSAKDAITISARSYCGVDSGTPVGTGATADNNGNDSSATVSPGSTTTDLVVDAMMTSSLAATVTVDASQTQRNNDTTHVGTILSASSDKAGATTSTTMLWTTNTDDYTGIVAVALKASAGAPAGVARRRILVMP